MSIAQAFSDFAAKYGKHYATPAEYQRRLAVFEQNIEMVNQQNAEHILIGGEAVFGITKFMDLTKEEFAATYLTYVPTAEPAERVIPEVTGPMAMTVDWTARGYVTPVKDQGQCGSCWAFSATEAIESYGALNGGYSLIVLSPQQITSCDKVDGGCNGGNTETAYQYVMGAGGLETNAAYPYTSGTFGITGSCLFKSSQVKVSIKNYASVAKGESYLQAALNNGPCSVCLAANAFQTYTGGILQSCPGLIDHCVQTTGYDNTYSTPYWKVRNSWGTSWGEAGYIRIAMGSDLCKIANDVTYPTF